MDKEESILLVKLSEAQDGQGNLDELQIIQKEETVITESPTVTEEASSTEDVET